MSKLFCSCLKFHSKISLSFCPCRSFYYIRMSASHFLLVFLMFEDLLGDHSKVDTLPAMLKQTISCVLVKQTFVYFPVGYTMLKQTQGISCQSRQSLCYAKVDTPRSGYLIKVDTPYAMLKQTVCLLYWARCPIRVDTLYG